MHSIMQFSFFSPHSVKCCSDGKQLASLSTVCLYISIMPGCFFMPPHRTHWRVLFTVRQTFAPLLKTLTVTHSKIYTTNHVGVHQLQGNQFMHIVVQYCVIKTCRTAGILLITIINRLAPAGKTNILWLGGKCGWNVDTVQGFMVVK